MITIQFDDKQVSQSFASLTASLNNPGPVLEEIGEFLIDSTRQRFGTSSGPDGTPWAKNSQTTILQYLGKYKSSFGKKDGRLTKKGAERASNKRPLIGETGDLSRQIIKKVEGNHTLLVGSTMIYGAVQQFGAKKRAFGRAPWGDVPARPFLGISDQDRNNILDTISEYLMRSVRP